MFWNRYFCPSFLILIIIAVLHWVGSAKGYYLTVEWLDFMMHFLGGAWVTLFTLWISEMSYGSMLKPFVSMRNVILFTIFVGVAWEVFEIIMGFSDVSMAGYAGDTLQDLVMDTLGSVAALALFFPKTNNL